MKIKHLFSVITLIAFFSCNNRSNEIKISGKIIGETPEKVEYTSSINGSCDLWFRESIKPDSKGNFEFTIKSNQPIFVNIIVSDYDPEEPDVNRGILIAESGKLYDIALNLNTNHPFLTVEGEASLLHNYYNKLDHPDHIQNASIEFEKSTDAIGINKTIERRRRSELNQFKEFYSDNSISDQVFNLITTDRNTYYSTLKSNIAWVKYITLLKRERLEEFNESYDKLWQDAFQDNLFNHEYISNSQWLQYYAEEYILYNYYLSGTYTLDALKEIFNANQNQSHKIKLAHEFLPVEIQEGYIANFLYKESKLENFEIELIDLYTEFKNNYPNSPYNRFLYPLIEDIAEFSKLDNTEYNEGIHFLDNYQSINSLSETVKKLNNSSTYVVLWATWCGACKDEFEYNTELKELLDSNEIEILYVSIDNERTSEVWRKMIMYYDLKGHHVLANKTLNTEIRNITRFIPRHLLLNGQGDIINNNASGPSKMTNLEKEITGI